MTAEELKDMERKLLKAFNRIYEDAMDESYNGRHTSAAAKSQLGSIAQAAIEAHNAQQAKPVSAPANFKRLTA